MRAIVVLSEGFCAPQLRTVLWGFTAHHIMPNLVNPRSNSNALLLLYVFAPSSVRLSISLSTGKAISSFPLLSPSSKVVKRANRIALLDPAIFADARVPRCRADYSSEKRCSCWCCIGTTRATNGSLMKYLDRYRAVQSSMRNWFDAHRCTPVMSVNLVRLYIFEHFPVLKSVLLYPSAHLPSF